MQDKAEQSVVETEVIIQIDCDPLVEVIASGHNTCSNWDQMKQVIKSQFDRISLVLLHHYPQVKVVDIANLIDGMYRPLFTIQRTCELLSLFKEPTAMTLKRVDAYLRALNKTLDVTLPCSDARLLGPMTTSDLHPTNTIYLNQYQPLTDVTDR